MADGGMTLALAEPTEPKEARCDVAAERAVLGAVLLDEQGERAVLPRVRAILRPRDFYDSRNELLFEVMCDLGDRRERIDVLTVCAALRALEPQPRLNFVGGAQAVEELVTEVCSTSQCEAHARLVAREARARRTRDKARLAAAKIDKGARDLTTLAREVADAAAEDTEDDLLPIGASVEAEESRFTDPQVTGRVSTHLACLDQALCGGFGGRDMVVIAACSSVGKSALVLQIADGITRRGEIVLYFSLEMSRDALLQRLGCQRSGVSLARVLAKSLDEQEFAAYMGALAAVRREGKLLVSERRSATISRIRARCIAAKARYGKLGAVVIDYLQRVKPDRASDHRERDVAAVSEVIQGLPMEAGCPVLAVCALNREADKRKGRPRLADLRESGSIGFDADAALVLWREKDDRTKPRVAVEKQRNGPVSDDLALAWDASGVRLVDAEGGW